MNQRININYIKTCKAILHVKFQDLNYDIINTEVIRYYPINQLCNKDNYNDYLINLLNSITLDKSIRHIQDSDEITYVGQTELFNISRISQYPDNVPLPLGFKALQEKDSDDKMYICKISDGKLNPNKIAQYPDYFIDNIFSKKSKEMEYLDSVGGNKFYSQDNKFIIVPDFISNKPFIPEYINNWLCAKQDKDLLYDLLTDIQFILFIKDANVNNVNDINKYQYKDIFSFLQDNKKSNIELLKEIKQTIYQFYRINLGLGDYLDPNTVQIFVNSDTKYNFIAFTFNIFNLYESSQYTSFINIYRTLKLDDFINMLETDSKPFYHTRLSKTDAQKYGCEGDLEFKSQQGGNNEDFWKLIKDPTKSFKILNAHYNGNQIHTYCSEFFLIEIDKRIFEISIKSITYRILNDYPNFSFYNLFMNKIKELLISQHSGYEYNYQNSDPQTKQKIIFSKLPAKVEIYIKEHNPQNLNKNIRVYLEESLNEYQTKILHVIKNNPINPSIIIHLLWKSEFRRLCQKYLNKSVDYDFKSKLFKGYNETSTYINQKLTQENNIELNKFIEITNKMLKNSHLGFYILDDFIATNNFTFNFKMADNNLNILLHAFNLNIESEFSKTVLFNEILYNNNNIYYPLHKKPNNLDELINYLYPFQNSFIL